MKNLLLAALAALLLASCASQPRGYNYKAHANKNAKFKHNNERGRYMKCNRH